MSESELGGTDEEGELASRGDEASGSEQRGFEALDGTKGHDIENFFGKSVGAIGLYIDIRQCKGASDLAEEYGLPVVGFDQRERE